MTELNRKPIKSFRDLDVYQSTYKTSVTIAARILPKLPEKEKFDLHNQLSRSSKAVPRLIAEGFAKKHQKFGFQKYLDDAMAECNETIVSLEHVKDIYRIEIDLCMELIDIYDKSGRQLYKLAVAWDSFKNKRRMSKTNDDTGSEDSQRITSFMKLDHIGIAVRSIDDSLKIWRDILGLKVETIKEVPQHKVKIALVDCAGVKIELLEPLGRESTVQKFLEKHGEGMHHLCFEVQDIEKMLQDLKNKGVKLIDKVPRQGTDGKKIAFVHPQDMGGVLIELCEK